MKLHGQTILITGGGSGIGRGLAEAFHMLGNHVIIAGRRKDVLDAVTAANPGMTAFHLDITDATDLQAFAERVIQAHPALNTVIHNAGTMKLENLTDAPGYLAAAEETIAINLLGPIRLTAALLPHLQKQAASAILMVSSGLAFVPMAATPTYSATKSALHAYCMALRHQLAHTTTEVIEIAPPYVQTELLGAQQASDPRAMPLSEFITEVMSILANDPQASEVIVERCKPLRFAAEHGKSADMFKLINSMNH